MPETTPVVDEVAKVREELAAFEASRAPKKAPPETGEKAGTDATKADAGNGTSGETAPVSTDASTPPEKAEKPPVVETAVDLSGLPDDIRKVIEDSALPVEVKKKVNEGFLRRKDYTQKTQALAEDRDAAAKWKHVVSDPERAKKVAEILLGKEPEKAAPQEEPEPEIDPFVDPNGYAAHVAKQAAAAASAEMAKIWRERVEAPMENKAALNAAIQRYADEHEVPKEIMLTAVQSVLADANETGVPLSPDLLPALLRPQVELARLKAKPTPAAPEKNGAAVHGRPGGLVEVASPNGRVGTDGGSTIPVPKHIREKRVALTADEISEEVEYAIRRRFGPDAR